MSRRRKEARTKPGWEPMRTCLLSPGRSLKVAKDKGIRWYADVPRIPFSVLEALIFPKGLTGCIAPKHGS